jgi:hypothetical protein
LLRGFEVLSASKMPVYFDVSMSFRWRYRALFGSRRAINLLG